MRTTLHTPPTAAAAVLPAPQIHRTASASGYVTCHRLSAYPAPPRPPRPPSSHLPTHQPTTSLTLSYARPDARTHARTPPLCRISIPPVFWFFVLLLPSCTFPLPQHHSKNRPAHTVQHAHLSISRALSLHPPLLARAHPPRPLSLSVAPRTLCGTRYLVPMHVWYSPMHAWYPGHADWCLQPDAATGSRRRP